MKRTILLAAVLVTGVGAQAQSLKIGDSAPKLEIAKWVKGTPVKEFAANQVYVVEFWATWCGPCRQSIPHLTELAKQYKGKVTIIGVNSFEVPPGTTSTDYFAAVEAFVKEMGAQMEYSVALDGPEGKMATTWMEAAAQSGIPTAFVVGGDKQILWIGHPMELKPVLDDVLAGKWDVKAARAKAEEEARLAAELDEMMGKLMSALEVGDSKTALKEIDTIIAKRPELKPLLIGLKVDILFDTDPKAAVALAKELANGDLKDDPMFLNNVAWRMVEEDQPKLPMDYAAALEFAKKAVELTKGEDPMLLDTLALAQYRNGMKTEAIATQKKAIALLEKDPEADPDLLAELKARLKKFEGG
jgi:thiol-disulfide isomerase/thioredoxin